jgi:hypothetical protein
MPSSEDGLCGFALPVYGYGRVKQSEGCRNMTISEHRDIVQTGDVRTETKVSTSRMVWSPGQVLTGILGIVTAVIGVIAVARGGIDGSLNTPVVAVVGLEHSALLGLLELGAGLLLILGALSYATRGLIVAVGVAMVIGGVILGAAGSTILRDIGTAHRTGWAIMIGGIIAIAAANLGRVIQTRHSVKQA